MIEHSLNQDIPLFPLSRLLNSCLCTPLACVQIIIRKLSPLRTERMSAGLPDAMVAEFKEAFSMFDVNGDATIDNGELRAVLDALGIQCSDEELTEMFSCADSDNNGTIDFEEFCCMMVSRGSKEKTPEEEEDEFQSVFRALDKDGDGWIGYEDLMSAVAKVNWGIERAPVDADVRQMINLFEEREGVDFHSFRMIIKKCLSM